MYHRNVTLQNYTNVYVKLHNNNTIINDKKDRTIEGELV